MFKQHSKCEINTEFKRNINVKLLSSVPRAVPKSSSVYIFQKETVPHGFKNIWHRSEPVLKSNETKNSSSVISYYIKQSLITDITVSITLN